MNDRKVENDTGVPKLSPKNLTQHFPISTSTRTVINRYFCIKGVKEAILARGGIISTRPEGPRDYKTPKSPFTPEMQTLFFVKSMI
jgi:hypothetical protein